MSNKPHEQPKQDPNASAAPKQPAIPETPRSIVTPPAGNRAQWVVNEHTIQAMVNLVRLSDNEAVEMFVMPQGRAEIPAGHAFDRSTLVKYPRVKLVVR